MRERLGLYLTILLAGLAAASCSKIDPLTAPACSSCSGIFERYVSMGTSVTAGWQSGGLVDRHQVHSYAYLFARQAGASSFTIPSVSDAGKPPLLRLVSVDPLVISNAGRPMGSPTNLAQPTAYHNMAVPYSLLVDVADSAYYYSGVLPRPTFPFEDIIRHRGTILQQVVSLDPTLVSMEYGSNEVLGPATSGSGTVAPGPAQFATLLSATLNALQAALPAAKLALLTVPDVTTIPFVTTLPPYVVIPSSGAHVPLIGPSGALAPEDYVLLSAADSLAIGTGLPVAVGGNGRPLLDRQVLSAAEAAGIQAAVDGYNDAIRSQATSRGAALVDLNGILKSAYSQGLAYQGTLYDADFITGGLFSLDGVHPTDLAHGFLCNAMIDAVNATFGTTIPAVDLSQAATITSSRLRRWAPDGRVYPVIEGVDRVCPQPFPWRAQLP